MSNEELIALYETNRRFMEYVDQYCWNHNLTLKVALTRKNVQDKAKYIFEGK